MSAVSEAERLPDQNCVSVYIYIYAFVEPGTDNAFAPILPGANGAGMQAFLDAFAATIQDDDRVVLVLDCASWHGSKRLRVGDRKLTNAKSETVASLASFCDAYKAQPLPSPDRQLSLNGARSRAPTEQLYTVGMKSGEPFALAAIGKAGNGQARRFGHTFAVKTCAIKAAAAISPPCRGDPLNRCGMREAAATSCGRRS